MFGKRIQFVTYDPANKSVDFSTVVYNWVDGLTTYYEKMKELQLQGWTIRHQTNRCFFATKDGVTFQYWLAD